MRLNDVELQYSVIALNLKKYVYNTSLSLELLRS